MEGWAVVEFIDFGQRENCSYWRGVVVHHTGFSGGDAQDMAEKEAKILSSRGLQVVVKKS